MLEWQEDHTLASLAQETMRKGGVLIKAIEGDPQTEMGGFARR